MISEVVWEDLVIASYYREALGTLGVLDGLTVDADRDWGRLVEDDWKGFEFVVIRGMEGDA